MDVSGNSVLDGRWSVNPMREKTTERKNSTLTDAEPKFLVRQEKPAVRCEICHQVDLFNPETGHCARCATVTPSRLPEYPQVVQEEVIQVPPPRPSNRRSGPALAFGIAILMYGMVQGFGLIREMFPPEWVERFAKTVLDPQFLVFIGMAVVLAMSGRKSSCRRRQKLANRENG
jgi:hypothetical protein